MATETQKLGSTSTQVFDAVAKLYDVTPEEAESIVAYHGAFRLYLGTLLNASQGAGYFETRASNLLKGVSFFSKITSIFSFGASELAASGLQEFEQFHNESELKQVAEVAIAVSEIGIHKFVKQLATRVARQSSKNLAKLTPRQAIEAAKKDVRNLRSQMANKTFKELVKVSEAANMLSEQDSANSVAAIEDKMVEVLQTQKYKHSSQENISSTSNFASAAHHTHKDLGNFTHQIIEKEHIHTEEQHHTHALQHKDVGEFTHALIKKEEQHKKDHDHT